MNRTFVYLGEFRKRAIESEAKAIANARRSLVSKKKIARGEVIVYEMLTWKRPASGISPRNIDEVIGKKALCDIEEDTAMKWEMIG